MTKRKASETAEVDPTISAEAKQADDQEQSTVSSTETLVNDVNTLSPEEFRKQYVKDEWLRFIAGKPASPCSFDVRLEHATTLQHDDFNRCLDLVKSTSQRDYEAASCGWNERRKKREMKSPEMYYLLLNRSYNPSSSLDGFLSFMVTHDSIPSVPVIYVYEIHLAESMRNGGIGARLMQIVENTARAVGVQKTMLTCFLANSKARNFYQRRGYDVDPTSPADRTTRTKTIKADYAILSKDVHQQPAGTSPDRVSGATAVRHPSADAHDALLGKVGQTADGLHKVPLNPGLEHFMNSFQTWTQNLQASQFISVSLRLSVNAQAAQRAGKLDIAAAERARFNRRYQLLKQSNSVAQGFCSLLAEYTARLEKEKEHLDQLWGTLDDQERTPDTSLRSDSGLSNVSHMSSVEKSFQAWQAQMSNFEHDLHRRTQSLTARECSLERRKQDLDQRQAALENREDSLLCLQLELQRQLGMMQRRESFLNSPPQTIQLPPKQCTEAGLRLHQTMLAQQRSENTSQWSRFDEVEQGSQTTEVRVDEWLARTF